MTQEEKAIAYDKAIKKAESLYKAAEPMSGCNVIIETLFPELKESEDERIRKVLIHLVKSNKELSFGIDNYDGIKWSDILAWLEEQGEHAKFLSKIQVGDKVTRNEDGILVNLSQLNRVAKKDEKQGEQKPAWSEEDDRNIDYIIDKLKTINDERHFVCICWLKSIKDRVQPKQEWSEDDEVKINRIVACLENLNVADNDILLKDVAWLKSLKERYRWKPSELQIEALAIAIRCGVKLGTWEEKALKDLIEQLKKLKGE